MVAESKLTFFAGNEARPAVIKQAYLPHWKGEG